MGWNDSSSKMWMKTVSGIGKQETSMSNHYGIRKTENFQERIEWDEKYGGIRGLSRRMLRGLTLMYIISSLPSFKVTIVLVFYVVVRIYFMEPIVDTHQLLDGDMLIYSME